MSSVRRVYVEKKPDFAVQAKDLKHEIHSYLGISEVTGVRVLIRYDVEHISDEVFEKACRTVFSEPPVDTLYRESFKTGPSDRVFSVEFLPEKSFNLPLSSYASLIWNAPILDR